MEPAERRDLYNGFGDALAKAFELMATPALFAFFGWLLDRRLGTGVLFTLGFGVFVFAYGMWKMWAEYDRSMREQEQKLLGRRPVEGAQ
jgi:hypothetical protein